MLYIKKTEALFQPSPDSTYTAPMVTIDNTPLHVTDAFCYLGSRIQRTGSLDEETRDYFDATASNWNTSTHSAPWRVALHKDRQSNQVVGVF